MKKKAKVTKPTKPTPLQLARDAAYTEGYERGLAEAADIFANAVKEARNAEARLFEERMLRVQAAHGKASEMQDQLLNRYRAAVKIIKSQLAAALGAADALL